MTGLFRTLRVPTRDGLSLDVLATERRHESTVIFVNALGMPHTLVEPLASELLAGGLGFVTWDGRGFPGPYDDSFRSYDTDCNVKDLTAIADHLELSSFVLSAWCTGIHTALAFAATEPRRVRSMVLFNSPKLSGTRLSGVTGDAIGKVCEIIVEDERKLDFFYSNIVANGSAEVKGRMTGLPSGPMQDLVQAPFYSGRDALLRYAHLLCNTAKLDCEEACRSIEAPVLVVGGRGDTMVSYQDSIDLAGRLTGGVAKILDDWEHYTVLREPARAAEWFRSAGWQGPASHQGPPAGLPPLRDTPPSSPGFTSYVLTFSGDEPVLRDHRLGGKTVLPAAAYVEVIRDAVARGDGPRQKRVIRVQNIAWMRPFVGADGARELHLRLAPATADGTIAFTFHDGGEADAKGSVYCRGRVGAPAGDDERLGGKRDVPALVEQCGPNTAEQHYEGLTAVGFEYGPAYRGLAALHVGPDLVVARMGLPELRGRATRGDVLHPSILDAVLQAAAAVPRGSAGESSKGLAMPFWAKEIAISAKAGEAEWAFLKVTGGDGGAGETKRAPSLDIDLCDARGEVVVRIEGYVVRASAPPAPPDRGARR